jgi:hypothetical protein
VLLALAACGGDGEPGGSAKPSPTPCAGLLEPADPGVRLPDGLPFAEGHTLYDDARQGATRLWFAHVPGDDVVEVRDTLAAAYESAGFRGITTDAEPPAEAELQFAGRLEGSVQVTPLCDGVLRVRYRVSS